jgi:hypothetical protein
VDFLERTGELILREPSLVAIGAIVLVVLTVRAIFFGGPPGRYG